MSKHSKLIILLSVLAICSFAVFAAEFKAYTTKSSFTVCPCESLTDNITIVNPTSSVQEFLVSVEGAGKGFINIQPARFRVQAQQKARIISQINVPCNAVPGVYDVLVKIKSNNSVLGFKQIVTVNDDCFNYSLLLGQQLDITNRSKEAKFIAQNINAYELCEYEQAVIPVYIKNNALYENTFDVSLKAPSWISFPYSNFKLKPHQAAFLFLTVNPPEKTTGSFDTLLTFNSRYGNVSKDISTKIILSTCYEPVIAEGLNKIKLNYSAVKTILPVKNTGIRNATYVFNITGEDWAAIQPARLFVEAGGEKVLYLQTKPNESVRKGTYKVAINALVRENDREYSKELKIKLVKGAFLASLDGVKNITSNIKDLIINYRWYIVGGLLVLIVLILIRRARRKRREEVSEEEEKPEQEKEEIAEERRFPWGKIVGLLILAGILYGIYLLITRIPWLGILRWILAFLGLYKMYILGAIGFLILAVIVMLVVKKIKKRSEEKAFERETEQEKSEEAEKSEESYLKVSKEPIRIPWGWIIGILILAAILYGAYLFFTKIPWGRIFSWIFGFIGAYKWYFAGAFGFLVLAIIIMIIFKKMRKAKEEHEFEEELRKEEEKLAKKVAKKKITKEEEITETKPPFFKIFSVLLVAAFVIYVFFRFWEFIKTYRWYLIVGFLLLIILILSMIILRRRRKKKAKVKKKAPFSSYIVVTLIILTVVVIGFLYTMGIKSQISKQENITLENVTSISAKQKDAVQMYKNTEKIIHLYDYFYDPDQDQLSFVAATSVSINVSIDNEGNALLTPELDWTGTTSVVFVADDGKGGIIEKQITFIVQDAPAPVIMLTNATSSFNQFFGIIRNYLGMYLTYIILGFGILICLIITIKFYKPIMHFFEEDEKPKKRSKKSSPVKV
jgi:large-conductance mechanosensitive channel